jgi:hypothetical protein
MGGFMRKIKGIIVSLIIVGALTGCQSVKPSSKNAPSAAAQPVTLIAALTSPPIAPGMSFIETEALGFSPTGESGRTTIDFALLFGNADAVKSWKISFSSDKGEIKSRTGSGKDLPATITWDGKANSGLLAAPGKYKAILAINYGRAFKEGRVTSTSFILDSIKPTGSISLSPELFSPMNPGDAVTIAIAAGPSLAKIDSWSLDVLDPGGNLFKTFSGKWPSGMISWDGRGLDGDLVVSAEDYPLIVRLRDQFGNVGYVYANLPVDILVIKQGDGYRIENSRVYFKDFTADYRDVPAELSKQNSLRLDQLAEKLKKYPDYKIKIVGHAVKIHWDEAVLGQIEQDSVLVPLSKARTLAIKQALVDRGLDPKNIETDGVGAADPLVPDSDYANRWRNRRTAIFLIK